MKKQEMRSVERGQGRNFGLKSEASMCHELKREENGLNGEEVSLPHLTLESGRVS